ncbi:hypothetical protein CHS0354_022822 [Potamilus streckersoni]|uniref:BZIP domain-containing protein n=1 Tax=Potamilus streckersoni TaxID=2493646 RepID=A0AAE0VMK3_9BIVA|nr:hypothetical protein CHS0354_022822 [Potamilus streckersoni]
MYKRSNSVVNVTFYLDSMFDRETSAASSLPVTLHEFPEFSGFSTLDHSLNATAVKAIESNDMMPVIKNELKNRIQFKKMAEGKEELRVDFNGKPDAQLKDEEKEKAEKRRIQNRMAARRFRERQNMLGTNLQKKTQIFESDNTSLRNQIRLLRKEREILQRTLQEHMSVCRCITGPYMHFGVQLISAEADLQ